MKTLARAALNIITSSISLLSPFIIAANVATIAIATTAATQARAAEFKGVTMPDQIDVSGKKLVLNGMGLRQADVFHILINVYVAGLYLEQKSNDGDHVINSPETRRVQMQFLRHVSAEDIRKTWEKGIAENCADKCKAFADDLAKLKSFLQGVDKGDTMSYTFDAKGVDIAIKDAKVGRIDNVDFAKAMLSTWLGPKPVTNELKSGLLGTAKK